MKTSSFTFVLLLIATMAFCGELGKDSKGVKFQTFAADPAKSQVNSAMTGTITFRKGTGGTVNITGWNMMRINPTTDSTYYFNNESTKTYPLPSVSDNIIVVDQLAAGEYITVVLGSGTASVQGM